MIEDVLRNNIDIVFYDYNEPRWAVYIGENTWGTRILIEIDLDYNSNLPNFMVP